MSKAKKWAHKTKNPVVISLALLIAVEDCLREVKTSNTNGDLKQNKITKYYFYCIAFFIRRKEGLKTLLDENVCHC